MHPTSGKLVNRYILKSSFVALLNCNSLFEGNRIITEVAKYADKQLDGALYEFCCHIIDPGLENFQGELDTRVKTFLWNPVDTGKIRFGKFCNATYYLQFLDYGISLSRRSPVIHGYNILLLAVQSIPNFLGAPPPQRSEKQRNPLPTLLNTPEL